MNRTLDPSRASILRRCLLAALLAAAGCGPRSAAGPAAPPPVPVRSEVVRQKDVPVALRTFGWVEACSTIEVKAQIGGQLVQVAFKEGDFVRRDDPLFTIDPRPYKAALDQAEANLARDQAQEKNARLEVKRFEGLLEKSYIARDDYDKAVAAADALSATVRGDQAAIENARVQLDYCSIRSPIDGRTGKLMANQGNLVKANADTPLLVITQVRPIYVAFSLPEKHLPDVRRYLDQGTVTVEATLPALPDRPIPGQLTFFSNQVDTTTGTILLRATYENQDLVLWPGQYVEVRIILTVHGGAVVVPTSAVQIGQQGSYVFVVKADRKVELRPVKPGAVMDQETVITGGLTPGERVVTEGQLRLVPGAEVEEKAPEPGVARQ